MRASIIQTQARMSNNNPVPCQRNKDVIKWSMLRVSHIPLDQVRISSWEVQGNAHNINLNAPLKIKIDSQIKIKTLEM